MDCNTWIKMWEEILPTERTDIFDNDVGVTQGLQLSVRMRGLYIQELQLSMFIHNSILSDNSGSMGEHRL